MTLIIFFIVICAVISALKRKHRASPSSASTDSDDLPSRQVRATNAFCTNRVVLEIDDSPYVKDKTAFMALYMMSQYPPKLSGPVLSKEEKAELGITSRRKVYRKELDLFTIEGINQNINAFFNSRYCFWQTFALYEYNLHQYELVGVKKVHFDFCRRCSSCPKSSSIKPGTYSLHSVPVIPCKDCPGPDFCTPSYSPKFH